MFRMHVDAEMQRTFAFNAGFDCLATAERGRSEV